MAVIAPQSEVYLLEVPLEMDSINQLTFANAEAQFNYFNSLPKKSYDNFTYQRKDGVLRIPDLMDDILHYNYVMYRNDAYSDKWFYAYIDSMEYLNDNVTAIGIKTDVWQTWQFDLVYKPVFVEREHVNDDTIGAHTLPEGLDKGEYVCNFISDVGPRVSDITWPTGYTYEGGNYIIAFQVTQLLSSFYSYANVAQNYNGVYSGLYIIGVDNAEDARKLIKGYAESQEASSDDIVSCFITFPHFFNAGYTQSAGSESISRLYVPKTGSTANILKSNITFSMPDGIDGYIPKNNKLFTGEFNYIYIDNNSGANTVLNYELFDYNAPSFRLIGSLSQGNAIKLIPVNYKNGDHSIYGNYQEGIIAGKLPVCAYASDYYLNWQTQNGTNIGNIWVSDKVLENGLMAGIGLATGGIGTTAAATGLIGSIAGSVIEQKRAAQTPNSAKGNLACSDLNLGYYNLSALGGAGESNLFTIKAMSVKREYAVVIDNFFSQFGYKVNQVKRPNITGRRNWNYVKTAGCYIEGHIPQDDLAEIKSMFDKGITFWHNPATFADYNQNNDII